MCCSALHLVVLALSTLAWLCSLLVASYQHREAARTSVNLPGAPQVVGGLEPRLAGPSKVILVPRGVLTTI